MSGGFASGTSSPIHRSISDFSRPVSANNLRVNDNLHFDRSLSGTPASLELDGSGSDYSRGRNSNSLSNRSSLSIPNSNAGSSSSGSNPNTGNPNVHAFVDVLGGKLSLSPAQVGDLHSLANVRVEYRFR